MKSDDGTGAQILSEPLPAKLPNGEVIYIRPEIIDPSGKVSNLHLNFLQVRDSLHGLAEVLRDGLQEFKASKTSVELSFELGVKTGGLVTMLVSGHSNSSIKVKLEWEESKK